MKLKRIPPNLQVLWTSPSAFLTPKDYILVLSHMRSYSSLLCHVLGSHEQISGYAEMHQAYEKRSDFFRLRSRVFDATAGNMNSRYVLDKVLHDRYRIDKQMLNRGSVHPIFLVRKPEATIKSLVNLGKEISNMSWFELPENSAQYYIRRLGTLVELAQDVENGNGLALEAENIIERPEDSLTFLARALGLTSALSTTYDMFRYTGARAKGDFSRRLRAGTIVAGASDYGDIVIPDESRARADDAYNRCLGTLRRTCVTMEHYG